jgi:hypothetical protein
MNLITCDITSLSAQAGPGLKHKPLDAFVIALPRASPPPPPISPAGAGARAGAAAAAAGLQRRGGGGAGHGPNAPLPHRHCNVLRWDACVVGWDGMGSGGLCVTAHLRIKRAVRSGRRSGGRTRRALARVGGWGMARGWWWGVKVTVNQGSQV